MEGVSEFLPISSTGHLILAAAVLKIQQTEFVKSFEIAIQLGAILSVCVLYWKSFLRNFAVFKRVAAAFAPTAVIGAVLYKFIKTFLMAGSAVVLWALFTGGILLIVFELLYKERPDAHEDLAKIPYKTAVIIGLFQSIAVIPGVSRAAATIIGGLALGLKRKAIVEFSFLLAVPTMLAAAGLDLLKSWRGFSAEQAGVLGVGFVVSFIVALLSIKGLLFLIKHHSFIGFGIYRIGLALVFWLFLL